MYSIPYLQQKILDSTAKLEKTLRLWQFQNEKIVFTNGCFDLLHLGHLTYLAEAKSLGTKLIVGLNADASVKRLKGEDRPVNPENTRTALLAALYFVDAVVVFEEDTPFNLITAIRPDVLVKGGDYMISTIVGADIVLAYGGEVQVLSFLDGYSSSAVIEKINTKRQRK
jgi:D-glycero-beta-D-manno-heptose 1-phosphate adenylyltransferase